MKPLIRSAVALLSLAAVSMAIPALAEAANAYVTGTVNLRAGPDISYPLVGRISAGTAIEVQGCTDGWAWCDVVVYGDRGWVAGNYIEYTYQDRPVLLPMYGARIGVPIVSFVIGTYWDDYYRNRPFYRERERWYQRRIERRPPPPPIRHPYRGPPIQGGPRPVVPRWDQRPSTPPRQPGHPGPAEPEHPTLPVRQAPQQSPVGPARPVQPVENHRAQERNRAGKPAAKPADKKDVHGKDVPRDQGSH